jgi:NADH-quinone oxidoreductase subunit F
MPRIQDIGAFNAVRESGIAKLTPSIPRITVGMGTCGRGNGAEEVFHALNEAIQRSGIDVLLASVGCFGSCFQEPLVSVRLPGNPIVLLHRVRANDAVRILEAVSAGTFPSDLVYCKIEEWDHITAHVRYGQGYPEISVWNAVPFFKGQKKIVLRNCGLISPSDIEEYIAVGGYQALYKVLIDGRPTPSSSKSRPRACAAAAAQDSSPATSGISSPRPNPTSNTSSATPMKATPALT